MEFFENESCEINSLNTIATSATKTWEGEEPYMRIVEQPHPTLYRFRYKSEGHLAGSIPGIRTKGNKKTVPTIEILNYTGVIDILVSCVTTDEPYLQHPHELVSKKNSKNGVYCIHLRGPPMQAALNNVGIRWVRRDAIEKSLRERKEIINFDPFGGGYEHKDTNINLSAVRLCFQGFIPIGNKRYHKLQPVISEPITNKKHVYELVINRLCSCSDKSSGGTEILMFCNPLLNTDVQIRFYEERHGNCVWESLAKFEKTDVHLKCGIAFRTPPYRDVNIEEPIEVLLQLVRISTEESTTAQKPLISQSSQPRPFTYYPDPDRLKRLRLEGKVQIMHKYTANNLEQDNQSTVHKSFHGNQANLNAMDFYANMDICSENTPAPTSQPFDIAVEPLVNSESQMQYQLEQLLQIWQSEISMSEPEVQPVQTNTNHTSLQQPQQCEMNQEYNFQYEHRQQHQQTHLQISHQNQCQTQSMLKTDQYQTFAQITPTLDPYDIIPHHTAQNQNIGQLQQNQEQHNTQITNGHVQNTQFQYQNNEYNL